MEGLLIAGIAVSFTLNADIEKKTYFDGVNHQVNTFIQCVP